jgi:galactokinase
MNGGLGESIARFEVHFGARPELLVESPGRVNLIGGSTDYNEGFVLPAAIDRTVRLLARRRGHGRLVARSTAMGATASMPLAGDPGASGWARHLAGILLDPDVEAAPAGGIDLLIDGSLPPGAGLGSSAALGVGFLTAVDRLAGRRRSAAEMIAICHRVENRFVGTRCGMMDQFTALRGARGKALLLDCRSATAEEIPCPGSRLAFLLFDSGVRRELARSGYNDRRRECSAAVEAARQALGRPIAALRDLTTADLPRLEGELEPALFRRCRHVVTENDRVLRAADALRAGDLEALGREVDASHRSLRDDFEVSRPELDRLHEACLAADGVYGSRLTGAGFGGSLLALCRPDAIDHVVETVSGAFRDRFTRRPGAILCRSADGVKVQWLD